MEKFQAARTEARKHLHLADHMISMTYPMVRENRLLVAITENLFLGLTSTLAALLYYERTFKRIPPFHDTFDSKFHMFTEEVSRTYGLNENYNKLLLEIRAILLAHRESPAEFSKQDSFVIFTENYANRKTVSIDTLKEHLILSKQFLKDVERIIQKDEQIFVGSKRGA